MILQLSPPLHLQTPKGPGWAHFLLDYGSEHHVLWGVAVDDGGAIWWVPNPEVRMSPNWSMERRVSPTVPCDKCGTYSLQATEDCRRPGCPLKPKAPARETEPTCAVCGQQFAPGRIMDCARARKDCPYHSLASCLR